MEETFPDTDAVIGGDELQYLLEDYVTEQEEQEELHEEQERKAEKSMDSQPQKVMS